MKEMKNFAMLYLAGWLLIALSCKKTKDQVPTTNDIKTVADLADQLKTETDISIFTNVLKQTAITTEDINSGITILSVSNKAFAKNAPSVKISGAVAAVMASNPNSYSDTISSPTLTTENIKDHIIKGVIDFSQVQSGRRLSAISGKIIQVIKSNDSVWLNGLLMEKRTLLKSDKYIVYEIPRSLTNTHPKGIISIAVYNATKWAADKPQGDPLPGYPVYLFRTQQDYASTHINGTPQYAYTAKTDASGNALFTDVLPGKYYLSAGMLDNTDTLFAEFRTKKQNNLLYGLSSDTLIQSTPPFSQPSDLPGTFIWPDTNRDGKIDDNDLQVLPIRSVQTLDEGTVVSRILVGRESNFNVSTIDQQENIMYGNFGTFTANRVMADGYMSQEVTTTTEAWMQFNNFTFTPATNYIANIWDRAWSAVGSANWIIQTVKQHSSIANAVSYIARAKLVRGITYLQLVTYFGDVPLLDENNFSTSQTPARTAQSKVLDFVLQDLADAAGALPNAAPSKSSPDKWTAYAALAKAYLLKKDYANAKVMSDNIINSGTYALTSGPEDAFQSSGNSEMLWAATSQSLGSSFKNYFYNRNAFPYVRYAEVLIINAEANIYLNNLTKAQTVLNMLQSRGGRSSVQLTSSSKIDDLDMVLKAEMTREGYHFAALVRLDLAVQQLSRYGYKTYNSVLPIPLSAISQNLNLVQNAGY